MFKITKVKILETTSLRQHARRISLQLRIQKSIPSALWQSPSLMIGLRPAIQPHLSSLSFSRIMNLLLLSDTSRPNRAKYMNDMPLIFVRQKASKFVYIPHVSSVLHKQSVLGKRSRCPHHWRRNRSR